MFISHKHCPQMDTVAYINFKASPIYIKLYGITGFHVCDNFYNSTFHQDIPHVLYPLLLSYSIYPV